MEGHGDGERSGEEAIQGTAEVFSLTEKLTFDRKISSEHLQWQPVPCH